MTVGGWLLRIWFFVAAMVGFDLFAHRFLQAPIGIGGLVFLIFFIAVMFADEVVS